MTQQSSLKAMMVVFAVSILWAGVGVSEALAERDGKLYPASMCKPAGTLDKQRMEIKPGGIVANRSTVGALRLFCPIVRDLMGHFFGDNGIDGSTWNGTHQLQKIDVHYKNSDPTRPIRCTAITQRPEGVPYNASSTLFKQIKTSSPTNTQGIIQFSGLSMEPWGEGYYTLECQLPGKASTSSKVQLSSYYVVELTN